MGMTIRKVLFMMLFIASLVIAGCSSEETGSTGNGGSAPGAESNGDIENGQEAAEDPITLVAQYPYDGFDEDYIPYIEEEFPHITIEWIHEIASPETLQELITQGNTPDMMFLQNQSHINHYHDMELLLDLEPIIEQHNFDLSRIEPNIIANHRGYDKDGKLRGLPLNRAVYFLFYNKDIFDRFAVSYPTDGMTWNEVYELATQLTIEDGGVQYRGLLTDNPVPAFTQFGLNTVNPKTHEVNIVDNEAYVRYLDMIDRIYSIPGNLPEGEEVTLKTGGSAFVEEQNIAMSTHTNQIGRYHDAGMNFDVVTFPVWEGYEGLAPESMGTTMAITKSSEHIDDAFNVLTFLLSDEFQTILSEGGGMSSLTSVEVHEAFMADEPDLHQYNLEAALKNPPTTGPEERSPYFVEPTWLLATNYLQSAQDVNEYLREVQEQTETQVLERLIQE